VLTESAAIVQYLSERFANPAKLSPASAAQARAILNEWCFIVTERDAASLHVVRRHQGLASIYGELPVAVHSAKAHFLDSSKR
jgi:glutathione S-transferase